MNSNEALRLQPAQRFAHRNMAHIQRGGDFVLLELHAAGQFCANNSLAEYVKNPFLRSANARPHLIGNGFVIHVSPHTDLR
ncbi:hypothetical protein SDC9_82242 [bioreactor metagenome]|uniref:Uncharacterized protein n=1 Tax=bioreactor metagenome TaxID=1076179 RepID=A0A644Z511_9ZZZZ